MAPAARPLLPNFINWNQPRNRIAYSTRYIDPSGGYGPDGKVYDTLGPYQLMRSATLEAAVKKHYEPEFFVYGTKGKAKAVVKAVSFGLDECRTNILAFCLDDASLASIGHPVFCSAMNIERHLSDRSE